MFDARHSKDFGNRNCQAELARCLLANMDPEDAIDFCVSNDWGGVLEHLVSPRSMD